MMGLDNTKLRNEVTYNLSSGRKMFYEGENRSDKEAGLLRYAKGLQSFQLWIQSMIDILDILNFFQEKEIQ